MFLKLRRFKVAVMVALAILCVMSGCSEDCVCPEDTSGAIVINPSPDSLGPPWTLAGPAGYSESGMGDQTLNGLSPGEYTVTWDAVEGWIAPPQESQTLSGNATVTFSGTYVEDLSESIVAWGNNTDGQCNVPAPNTDFVSVSGGGYHSLCLKSNGSITAWGGNGDGQCDIPQPNAEFSAVAACGSHSLGLKSDGSIVAWGLNVHGQCDVPAPNVDFIAVAEGGVQSLALKSNGSIVAWGYNGHGECDVPQPNADFIAANGGEYHSLGLKSDGSIVAWGYNINGQCDVP